MLAHFDCRLTEPAETSLFEAELPHHPATLRLRSQASFPRASGQTRSPGRLQCVFLARVSAAVLCSEPETAVIAAVLAPIGQEHHQSLPSLEMLDFQRFRMAVSTYKGTLRRAGNIFGDHMNSFRGFRGEIAINTLSNRSFSEERHCIVLDASTTLPSGTGNVILGDAKAPPIYP